MAHHRAEKFGGAPQNLSLSDLPTFGDLARCFWKAFETETHFKDQVIYVENQLLNVWERCSRVMPLVPKKCIHTRLTRFLDNVKTTSLPKKSSRKLLDDLELVRQKLFDIAACTCQLPIAACDDARVKCSVDSCAEMHILCLCEDAKKVPVEERTYLKDQRSKIGTFGGSMQMAGPDRTLQLPVGR